MILDTISIIFFFFPSLMSLTSTILYFKDLNIDSNFISISMGYISGNIIFFIIYAIFQNNINKKIKDFTMTYLMMISSILEFMLFLFYELNLFKNDYVLQNLVILNRLIFFLMKILGFTEILIFNKVKISFIFGSLLINEIIFFLINQIKFNATNVSILFFGGFSTLFLILILFYHDEKLNLEEKNQIFAEILKNSNAELLLIQKLNDKNKVLYYQGKNFLDFKNAEKKEENLQSSIINCSFTKLNKDSQYTLKSSKSINNSKKKFTLSLKDYPLEEEPLNLNETINEIDKKSLKPKFFEYFVCLKNSNFKRFQMKILPIQLIKSKNRFYAILLFNDFERKQEIKKLKKIVESNKRFFSSFSHELKTPINGALPLLQIAHNLIINDRKNADLIEIAIGSIKLLHNSIDNILNFYLFESDQFFLNISSFWLKDIIEEIKSIIIPMVVVKNLTFTVRFESIFNKMLVNTDYEKLRQILLNLLTNAVQFTLMGSISLIIELVKPQPFLIKFSIEDTGIGIEESQLSDLRSKLNGEESFFEKHINSTGSCLGLLICQRISYLLGGGGEEGIKIKSEQGVGSIFEFTVDGGVVLDANEANAIKKITCNNSYVDLAAKAKINSYLIEEKRQSNKSFNKLSERFSKSVSEKDKTSHNVSSRTSSKPLDVKDKLHNYNFENGAKLMLTEEEESDLSKTETNEVYTMANINKRKNSDFSSKSVIFKKGISSESLKKKGSCDCGDVLIVDDDAFNLLSLEIMLQSFHLKCMKAMSGREGIEKLKRKYSCENKCKGIRLIFMDYQMPIMDGMEACLEIMKLIKNKEINNIPIIGCTAFISKDQVISCLEIGMKDVIFKPITKNVIKNILEEWFVL